MKIDGGILDPMKKKNIEIEIKVRVGKSTPLINFLKKKGEFVGKSRQVDTYYIPVHRNFVKVRPAKEWLRLRRTKDKFFINYKNWHYDNADKTNYCDEYETAIGDIESLEKIFRALDIKPITSVDKKRQIWVYKNYEIAIDKIKGLGDFVEIEYKGEVRANPKKVTDEMVKFLKDLGCGRVERNYQGYPFLLLFPKEVEYEEI